MTKSRKTSLLTKTGKTLLGPLNLRQLTEMLEKSAKPKERAKITNRLKILSKRARAVPLKSDTPAPTVEETVSE